MWGLKQLSPPLSQGRASNQLPGEGDCGVSEGGRDEVMDLSPIYDSSFSAYQSLFGRSSSTSTAHQILHHKNKRNEMYNLPSTSGLPSHLFNNEDLLTSSSEDRPFPCLYCDAKFKKKQHLQNHERIHSGEKYVCDICKKGFSRLHILKHHVIRKHLHQQQRFGEVRRLESGGGGVSITPSRSLVLDSGINDEHNAATSSTH